MSRNTLVIFSTALLLMGSSAAEVTRCDDHTHTLTVEGIGYEHVNHLVRINGKIPVQELIDELWFIEEVQCTASGFLLEASHAQYGEHQQKSFEITILDMNTYSIEEGP